MVVAANMAFSQLKGVAKDPKDYQVYKKPKKNEVFKEKVIIKEVPVIDEEEISPIFKKKYEKFMNHLKNNNIKIPKKFR